MTVPANDDAALISAVDEGVAQVRTRQLDISFNEILDMHASGELVITPEYQRLFRWSVEKQSQFIESLALEMPIPPIYVIEIQDNVYELIDGLQRISSYLHFRGKHPDRPGALQLTHCDILPELNGKTFEQLPTALKIKLKRPFIRVEIIRKGSDPHFRYHMFKRLNTGGESLSAQEVRNCTIRLLDTKFIDFVNSCAKNTDYRKCMDRVQDNDLQAMYLEECVLRFFALKNARDKFDHEVGSFLTDYMESVSMPDKKVVFDEVAEQQVFDLTFAALAASLGDQSFSTFNPVRKFVMNNFSANHFESIALGVAENTANINPSDAAQMQRLRDALLSLKADAAFLAVTKGGGLNYRKPLLERISLAVDAVKGAL